MRLAFISFHSSPLAQPGEGDGGGMSVYVLALATSLARSGLDCEVYTRASSAGLPPVHVVEPGLRVHHIEAGPPGPLERAALADRSVVEDFSRGVLERIGLAGSIPDVLYANYWLSGTVGRRIKEELGIGLLTTFHTLARVKGEDVPGRAIEEATIVDCSDLIVVPTLTEGAELSRLYGADAARVRVVAPGVDHAFFSPGDRRQARRAAGLDNGRPLVLFAGRLQPLKGPHLAIEALRLLAAGDRLPRSPMGVAEAPSGADGGVGAEASASCTAVPCDLAVIGGPSGAGGADYVKGMRILAAELERTGGGRVHFIPPVAHELLSTYYRAADVCVVPSRSESFGLVALEAAACGTPVVATDVGGLSEIVDGGSTGLLVGDGAAGDEGRFVESLAEALSAVIDDGELASRMGAAAAWKARRYTWRSAAAKLGALAAEVASEGAGSVDETLATAGACRACGR